MVVGERETEEAVNEQEGGSVMFTGVTLQPRLTVPVNPKVPLKVIACIPEAPGLTLMDAELGGGAIEKLGVPTLMVTPADVDER